MSYLLSHMIPALHVANSDFHGRGSLQGWVISDVNQKEKGKREIVSFTLKAESWWTSKVKTAICGNVRVTLLNSDAIPKYGDYIRVKGILNYPKSAVNPGEFDYKDYLDKQNIKASIIGFGHRAIKIIRHGSSSAFIRKILELRNMIHKRVYELAPAPERDILLSLITGERTNIPREITDDFVRTGTVHVLAISGFQISMVAGFTFLLLRFLGFSMKITAMFTGLILIFYVPLAGSQLPVERAGIMGLVVMGAVILGRGNDVLSALCLAFFVLLMVNPNNLYSVAFQLSFISVLALMGIAPKVQEMIDGLGSGSPETFVKTWWSKPVYSVKILFVTTLAATLGTWPLVLYYFHVLSFTSIAANFLIVPLTTFALFFLIGVLAVSIFWIPVAKLLITVPVFLVSLTIDIAHQIARISAGYIYLPSPNWVFIVIYYLFLIIFALGWHQKWSPKVKQITTAALLLTMIGIILPLFQSREQMVFLNVPGSSVVFAEDRTRKSVLFNGGKGESSSQDYWTVIPFLKSQRIKKIDSVFITSNRKKFWSGLIRISDHCRFKNLILPWPHARDNNYQKLISKIRKAGGSLCGLIPGNIFNVSESIKVKIYGFEKNEGETVIERLKVLGMLIQYQKIRILMLDEGVDLNLLTTKIDESIEILYITGSKNMSIETASKLLAVNPKVVILANGPSKTEQTLKEFFKLKSALFYNLKETGALTIQPQNKGFLIRSY